MTISTTVASAPSAIAAPRTRLAVAAGAFLLGLGLFVTTGFAWPSAIHNATHDTRHSLGLPCH